MNTSIVIPGISKYNFSVKSNWNLGSPGIVYLMVNKTIRGGVISLIFGKKKSKVESRPNATSNSTGKVQVNAQDQIDSYI